jgi:hypothetical protein
MSWGRKRNEKEKTIFAPESLLLKNKCLFEDIIEHY